MPAKQAANQPVNQPKAPRTQYATDERVRAAAKLALLLHGPAFRALAHR